MDPVEVIIDRRRSLRALEPVDPSTHDISVLADQLTAAARLAPSADNSQPWRFVSVHDEPQLSAIRAALSPLNQWASVCSLFIVVCSSPVLSLTGPSHSSRNGPINYYLYDTGLASAFLMLRATDFNLVAHPIAGFDGAAVARAIGVAQSDVSGLQVVSLIAIGQKSANPAAIEQIPEPLRAAEIARPDRLPLEKIAFHNSFGVRLSRRETIEEERPSFDRDLILVNDDGRIYHLDQATLTGLTSVDEMPPTEQVAYGFIKELTDLGISVAAIPTIPSMNAAIFCYLLNLGSLKPPLPESTPAKAAKTTKPAAKNARSRQHEQYSGVKENY